jgi:acyl carrier protein
MPADSSPVARAQLPALVRDIIAEVLMVAPEDVRPDTALVRDLGAESLDFLDLLFRLEEGLGRTIPPERWSDYVRDRTHGEDLATALTAQLVLEFAERELSGA